MWQPSLNERTRSDSRPDVCLAFLTSPRLPLCRPLFPGADYLDQLRLIIGTLGTPSDEETRFVRSERAKAFLAKQVRDNTTVTVRQSSLPICTSPRATAILKAATLAVSP